MLGDELRKARLSAGLTQEELAHRARVSRNYVSELERSAKSPTVDTLLRLCEAMETRASVLLAAVEAARPGKAR